jgi:hypothetical protein
MSSRAQHATFPLFHPGLVPALSDEPVLIEGMKVLFDEKVGLYPVRLDVKKRRKGNHGTRERRRRD